MSQHDLIKQMQTEAPDYRTYSIRLSDLIVATVVTDEKGFVMTSAVGVTQKPEQMKEVTLELLRDAGAEGYDLVASQTVDLREGMVEAVEFALRSVGASVPQLAGVSDEAVLH